MEKNLRLDFISSLVTIAVAVAFLVGSLQIHARVGGELFASPAFTPLVVSVALLVAGLVLAGQSLRNGGLRARLVESRDWFVELGRKPYTIPTTIGLALMAIYVFALMPRMPFWASSFIFMIAMLAFLRAARWWVILLVSAGLVGGVMLIFQVLLRAPLP